jgi:integrase/recombinase XerD
MMTAAAVQGLLDHCPREDTLGIRDYAVLMLVARLGLRSIEVARLRLEDVDWRSGEIVIRGKGRREDRLPLPVDVGEALVAYLSDARPEVPSREVFVTCRAPRGPIRADLVSDVVKRAWPPRRVAAGGPAPAAARTCRRNAAARRRADGDRPGASTPGPRHDRALCEGRLHRPARGRAALARTGSVTGLREELEDYLQLRRSLGHQMAEAAWLLPDFVAFMEARGQTTVTIAAALAWVKHREGEVVTTVSPRRITAVRGFTRYLTGIDPATEVPPLGLVPHRQRWRQPFLYSEADITATLGGPLRAATYRTLVGLLAAAGLRIGEAINLDHDDIDWAEGMLLIRESKFGKSRLVPLQPSSMNALREYDALRAEVTPRPRDPAFFISRTARRLIYAVVSPTFRQLITTADVGTGAPHPPRLHDLRHSFAIRTLLHWYRAGDNVQAKIPSLSTYLGHREQSSTYWYLSAAPELLALAAARREGIGKAARS